MKIKGFLASLVLGATLAAPAFADRLTYPIESRADPGTVLDEQRAAKVRRLVEYAITKPNKRGVVEYVRDYASQGIDDGVQDIQVAIELDDTKYTLLIQNYPQGQRDSLHFYVRPRGRYNPRTVRAGWDGGLDGRVNVGSDNIQGQYDKLVDTLLAFYEGPSK